MPKIFTAKQKIKIVQYGDAGVETFCFKAIANDFFDSLKKIIVK